LTGGNFPLPKDNKARAITFERTEAIGREVAKAAVDALDRAEWSPVTGIEVKKAPLQVPMDNEGFLLLMQKGVLKALPMPIGAELPTVSTWVYAITLGDAQLLTAPGKLFPEVLHGVAKYRRSDCPAADTRRPSEPAVWEHMTKKYRFLLG
jgi:hypothetical protein